MGDILSVTVTVPLDAAGITACCDGIVPLCYAIPGWGWVVLGVAAAAAGIVYMVTDHLNHRQSVDPDLRTPNNWELKEEYRNYHVQHPKEHIVSLVSNYTLEPEQVEPVISTFYKEHPDEEIRKNHKAEWESMLEGFGSLKEKTISILALSGLREVDTLRNNQIDYLFVNFINKIYDKDYKLSDVVEAKKFANYENIKQKVEEINVQKRSEILEYLEHKRVIFEAPGPREPVHWIKN